jgi:hypothetical protein
MPLTLDQQIVLWQPFFITMATVAATLVGLLFVSLSINRGLHRARDRHPSGARQPQRLAPPAHGKSVNPPPICD